MPPHLNRLLTIAISAFILLAAQRTCFAKDTSPSSKDLKSAEKVLTKLVALQTLSTNAALYKTTVDKFYPELYVSVSALRESRLKTDLSTAVFLYERAYLSQRHDNAASADCDLEAREVYNNLCTARVGQTRAQLLHAKAGLHTAWASAQFRYFRGDRDAATVSTLSAVATGSSMDRELARRLVGLLKTLDDEVNSYSSLGEFEARNTIAKVSFGKLSRDFRNIASEAYLLLSSLPRNSLTYHLQNALNSYHDGLFWWEKTYRQKEMVVSANNWTEPAPKNPLGFDSGGINYAVVTKWRKASRHIASAAVEIERAVSSELIPGSIARVGF